MSYPFAFDHLEKSPKEDSDVQGKGLVFEVVLVKLNLYRNGQLIAAVYLGPAFLNY